MTKRIVFFLLLNLLGLAIGNYFFGQVPESWFKSLNHPSWEPSNSTWTYGALLVAVLFSVFLGRASKYLDKSDLRVFDLTFAGAWVLHLLWYPTYFHFQQFELALFIILVLLLFAFRFVQSGWRDMGSSYLLALPYFVWIAVSTAHNAYFVLNNG